MSETEQTKLPDHPFRPEAQRMLLITQSILNQYRAINEFTSNPDGPSELIATFVVDQSLAMMAFVMGVHEHMFPGELAAKGIGGLLDPAKADTNDA